MKLAFYKAWQANATFLDKFIAFGTIAKHSHVELVFRDNVSYSISGRDGGARFKEIDFSSGRWDVIDFHVSEAEEAKMREMAKSQLGTEYDYIGAFFSFYKSWKILENLFSKCLHKKNLVFCSEVVVNILRLNTTTFAHLEEGCKYAPGRLYKEMETYKEQIKN